MERRNPTRSESDVMFRAYEYILDRLEDGVHVIDEFGQTIVYNAKMAEIEAMNKGDVLHRNITDIFAFRDHENSTLLQALRGGEATLNVRQTYFNNKGEEIVTLNSTFPIRDEYGILGAVEVAKDITKMQRILQDNVLHNGGTRYTFENIIGDSTEIKEVIQLGKRAARTNSSVLIVGETGTGKELFAQSIHNASPRYNSRFIAQNCAALPDSLIEGLLFGTTRGSFTGATDKPGLLEMADGGTLLLDELNSLSPVLQAKLLRFLQERTVRRIGGTKDKLVDVRIIATVNEDPLDAIVNNRLRKDLYYRLGVVTLFIPPLRLRKEDITQLIEAFIAKYNHMFQMNVPGISNDVLEKILGYDWPGNIRELEHMVEGAMNIVEGNEEIGFIHLPYDLRRKLHAKDREFASEGTTIEDAMPEQREVLNGLQTQLDNYEHDLIENALRLNRGNVSAAAKQLHMSRQNLQYRLKKIGILARSYK